MALDAIVRTIRDAIKKSSFKHQSFVYSLDVIPKDTFSIEFSRIPLRKPSKFVYVYFAREAIYAYQQLLNSADTYKESKSYIDSILKQLDELVTGWNHGKEITKENVGILTRTINHTINALHALSDSIDENLVEFNRYNTDEEGMIDRFTLAFYKPLPDIPYKSVYKHFFKKKRLPIKELTETIDGRVKQLDHLIELMDLLYAGYEHAGKGEAFEEHRVRQKQLILFIQSTANLVELELNVVEKIIKLRDVIINVKVYPE